LGVTRITKLDLTLFNRFVIHFKPLAYFDGCGTSVFSSFICDFQQCE